jgi:formylglycine-generating enzyme required for sulfatase activity
MVVVPAGSFTMGAAPSESGYDSWFGTTQVAVMIARPFAVGKYAITFDEWDACVSGGGCNGYSPGSRGWYRGRYPAIDINWHDAQAYIAWLSVKTAKSYGLPSESQREYYTRAGTTTPFWWGDFINDQIANYHAKNPYNGMPGGAFRQRTVPVDSFAPNAWGLFNVHGNVSEWTEDCWNASNIGNPGDGSARLSTSCQRRTWKEGVKESKQAYVFEPCEEKSGIGTPSTCTRRVLRSGDWQSSPYHLRSAHRFSMDPSIRAFAGFRVVRHL